MVMLPDKSTLDGSKIPPTTTSEMKIALGTLRDFISTVIGSDNSDDIFVTLAGASRGAQPKFNPLVTDGYPIGALLESDDGLTIYNSLVDNNTANFNTDPSVIGASWIEMIDGAKLASALAGIKFGWDAYPVNAKEDWETDKKDEYGDWVLPSPKWMIEDGRILEIADYPELFAIIGTTYGGDGVTTFALNDMRGQVRRGLDLGRGIDPDRVLGSEQADQMQGHWHELWEAGASSSGSAENPILNKTNPATTPIRVKVVDQARGIISDGVNGTPRIGSETRGRNRAYLPIIKVTP